MKFKAIGKPIKTKLIAIALLIVLIILISLAENFPNFIERWYSEGLYPIICTILHTIFNIFPFSAGDVFYITLIICALFAIYKIFRLLFTKKWTLLLNYLLRIVIVVQILYFVFYLFWGLNYYRPSAAKRLSLQDTSYTLNDIKTVTAMMIDSANAARSRLSDSDLKVGNSAIFQTAAEAIGALQARSKSFTSYQPKVKSSLLTWASNYLGTAGYYNPFTGESQVNYQMPVFVRPVTAAHELSHQMGFGAEDEADFVGFIAGVSSQNKLLKYSAYYLGTEEFMRTLYRRDSVTYKSFKGCISSPVLADLKAERLYWQSFEGRAGTLSGIFYDHFLKANNQPHGLKTYNRMVRLTMALYKKDGPAFLQAR